MNYVEVKGGLGNQLFQYAFAGYLENKTGVPSVLHVEFFDYVKNVPGATVREFELTKLNAGFISVTGSITCGSVVEEKNLPEIGKGDDNCFYSGYWQSKKYFGSDRERFRRELTPKDRCLSPGVKKLMDDIDPAASVSVHIRRSDYLTGQNRDIFSELTEEYYRKAVLAVKNAAERDDLILYVFSDDMDWASTVINRIHDRVVLMPYNNAHEDLFLMSRTRHHIIANSTFSWWGAALGTKEDGITVAPSHWFRHDPDPDLYPEGWIVTDP